MNNTKNNTNDDDIILYTVKDIQRIFHCCKNHAYLIMRANGFPSIKINNKIFVPKNKLETWIDKNVGKEVLL